MWNVSIVRYLAVVSFLLLFLSGCHTCEQDYPPPWHLGATANPYHFSKYSSDLETVSSRWENVTAGFSANGSVTGPVYECFFLVGCNYWMHIEADIELLPGDNLVYLYTTSGQCEWRDDYLISFN